MAEFTPHQKKIVDRYYAHKPDILITRLQEIVSEMYLADKPSRIKSLWGRAEKAMVSLGVAESIIKHLLADKDAEVLARHVREWGTNPPNPRN